MPELGAEAANTICKVIGMVQQGRDSNQVYRDWCFTTFTNCAGNLGEWTRVDSIQHSWLNCILTEANENMEIVDWLDAWLRDTYPLTRKLWSNSMNPLHAIIRPFNCLLENRNLQIVGTIHGKPVPTQRTELF